MPVKCPNHGYSPVDNCVICGYSPNQITMDTTRHGSPEFYKLLDECAQIHSDKSHDYANNDNPSGNYLFAGLLACLFSHSSDDAGFASRIGEKIYRLANLEKDKKIPLNESIEDTERDIVTITALWIATRRTKRAPKSAETSSHK